MPTHQLLFGFTIWGFEGIEKPAHAGLARLGPAGYQVVETNEATLDQPGVLDSVREHGLQLVLQCYPMTVEDLRPSLRRAKQLGALHVNAHAASAHLGEDETASLVNGLYDVAQEEGVKLMLETHRGRLTQDLYRTARLCERVDRLRLNLDVSHFIVCEERPGPTADLAPMLDVILDRVEMIHGRVSNGQQVQVDAGDGSGELPRLYRRFWAEAMRRWQRRSRAGSALVFTPELGAPDYAIRDPQSGAELSDRWAQSQVLRGMAEQAWADAKAATEVLWP